MSNPFYYRNFGYVEFGNEKLLLLTQLLNKELIYKIEDYRKNNNCGYSTALWSDIQSGWKVIDNKLHLMKVWLRFCRKNDNLMKKIFKKSSIFAKYYTGAIEVVKKEEVVGRIQKGRVLKRRTLLEMQFYAGILQNVIEKNELLTSFYIHDFIEK